MRLKDKYQKVLKAAIKHFGVHNQTRKVMEECSELSMAASKIYDTNNDFTVMNLTEEIADVLVMIEQLKLIYDITDYSLKLQIISKINQLETRMEKEKQANDYEQDNLQTCHVINTLSDSK
jgi:NTP pyrophosphatase (non-canonical NTP hydrolase)